MQLNRRDFLKLSVPATMGLFVLGGVPIPKASQNPSPKGDRKAILYDSSKCIGCRLCEAACRTWNELPEPIAEETETHEELTAASWTVIKAIELDINGQKEVHFSKRQCMHCTEASCVAVCPTGAAVHRDGHVEIDQEWCVGCGYCLGACPFGVPHREPPLGTARKCTLCNDRVTEGLKPACVEACPIGALTFGDRAELITNGKTRVEELVAGGQSDACLYGETELGGLGVMHILRNPPSFYDLPQAPRQATANVFVQWGSGIATAGVLALPFLWLFRRKGGSR